MQLLYVNGSACKEKKKEKEMACIFLVNDAYLLFFICGIIKQNFKYLF